MKSSTLQKEGKGGHPVIRYTLRHASVRGQAEMEDAM